MLSAFFGRTWHAALRNSQRALRTSHRALRTAGAVLVLSLFISASTAAQILPRDVLPDHYDIRLALNFADNSFTGDETLLVEVQKPTTTITLNSTGLAIEDVRITSGWSSQPATVTVNQARQVVTLTVRRKLAAGAARIELTYSGRMTRDLRGLYYGTSNNHKWAATQFEATYARRAFPCFDEPDMKASFSMTAVVPADAAAISNGRVLSDTPGPGSGQHTIKFSTTKKISSYLVALAVGDFDCVSDTASPSALSVPLRVCAIRGQADHQRFALEAAVASLRFYGSYFTTKYPFTKLDLVAIPEFDGGGMENAGAIFFGEDSLLVDSNGTTDDQKKVAATVSHEIAHQWLGDLVTMKWWDDLWLKEGLATWMETKPLVAWKPQWHADLDQVASAEDAMAVDELEATHPVRVRLNTPADIEDAYDAITYQKAAAVARMLEGVVGPDAFRNAINSYLRKFEYSNADSNDFQTVLAEFATTRPVDGILRTFLEQAGVPLVTVSTTCDTASTSTISVTETRFSINPGRAKSDTSTPWLIPLFTRNVAQDGNVAQDFGPANTNSLVNILTARQQQFPIGGCNPFVAVNAGAAGYFRTRYAPEAIAAVAKDASRLLPAERLRLIDDEWALSRANQADIGDYMSLLAGMARAEHGQALPQTVDRITGTLLVVDRSLVADADRLAFRSWVVNVLRPLASSPPALFALGAVGRDQEVLAHARQQVTGATTEPVPLLADSEGPPAVPATEFHETYAKLAAVAGDSDILDRLVSDIENGSPEVDALGYFSDPALVERALTFALSDRVNGTDSLAIVVSALQNSPAAATAWAFVRSHWDDLMKKTGNMNQGAAAILDAVSSACDTGTRDSVKAFFDSKGYSGSRALKQSIEKIQACADFRSNQSGNFKRWIDSTSAPKSQR